jgi:DNA replication licensing factor MCM5
VGQNIEQIAGRQLEALIRISEALAKLTLAPVVQNHHVEEAIRLFKFSTMDAVSAGSADGLSRGELNEEMTRIERELRRRLPVGWSTSYQSLVREFVSQQGYSNHALERTLFILEKREVIRFSGQVSGVQCLFDTFSDGSTEKSCTQVCRRIFPLGLGYVCD